MEEEVGKEEDKKIKSTFWLKYSLTSNYHTLVPTFARGESKEEKKDTRNERPTEKASLPPYGGQLPY